MSQSARALLLVGLLSFACKKHEESAGGSPGAAPAPPQGASESPGAAVAAPANPTTATRPAGSLANFEGEIEVAVKVPDQPQATAPMKLLVKGKRLRFEVPAGMEHDPGLGSAPHVTLDLDARTMTAIADERRMAVVIGFDSLAERLRGMGNPGGHGGAPAATASPPPKIVKTGKNEVVAGYECEVWKIDGGPGQSADVCVSSEKAPFLALPFGVVPTDQAWSRELFDGARLPLRIVARDPKGETRLAIQKIERRAVPDGSFETPAGYQVMDLGKMAEQMRGAGIGKMPPGMRPPAGMPTMPRPH